MVGSFRQWTISKLVLCSVLDKAFAAAVFDSIRGSFDGEGATPNTQHERTKTLITH